MTDSGSVPQWTNLNKQMIGSILHLLRDRTLAT